MLEDVAAFLILAPIASSLATLVGVVWLIGHRWSSIDRAAKPVTFVEGEAPTRRKS
jgi:hypothetical protein